MPTTPVRVGVPTTLARDLIQRVVAGFVDQVTLELKNLKVKKSGKVKKVVTIGQYDLKVDDQPRDRQAEDRQAGRDLRGQQGPVALPVTVASGSGNATINFKWDGKNVAGATCGDLEVTQEVSGSVRPDSYPVVGRPRPHRDREGHPGLAPLPGHQGQLEGEPVRGVLGGGAEDPRREDGRLRLRRREGQRPRDRAEADRQGLQRPPAHREDQADGDAGGHRADAWRCAASRSRSRSRSASSPSPST